MATLEETLKSLGLSAVRGIPQLATGFVDLAALPFTATGLLKPEEAVGSTAYLTSKGLLPPEQQGLLNQTTELVSGAINPATATKAALAKSGLLMAPIAAGSIKPIGLLQSASPLVREGNPIQSAVVLIGDKIFTGRTHSDALQRAIYEGAIRKEAGRLVFPKDVEINSDLFMTKDGRIIDRLDASKLFDIGASETAIKEGLMQNKPAGSMSVESYMTEAKKLKNKQ